MKELNNRSLKVIVVPSSMKEKYDVKITFHSTRKPTGFSRGMNGRDNDNIRNKNFWVKHRAFYVVFKKSRNI